MRVIVIFSIIALSYGESHFGNHLEETLPQQFDARILEGPVKASIECIRILFANGDESIGLPPLDPLVIKDLDINLDQFGWEQLKGNVSLKNVIDQGAFSWKVSKLTISPTIFPLGVKLTLNLEWDSFNFQGNYGIDANVLDHEINGVGEITSSAHKFTINLKVQATTSSVKNIEIKPQLEAIDFHIGQLVVDGNDVSDEINNNVNNVLRLIHENLGLIGDRLAAAILDFLNKNLYNYSTTDGIVEAVKKCIKL